MCLVDKRCIIRAYNTQHTRENSMEWALIIAILAIIIDG